MNEACETLDLEGVALLFGAEPETVAQYARTGELPGTRIGKGWIFLKEDALAFLRQRIARDTATRRATQTAPEPVEVKAVLMEHRSRRRRRELPVLPNLPASTPSSP